MNPEPRNVVVDYGNSAAKVGIFTGDALLARHVFADAEALKSFLQNFSAAGIIISSVNRDAAQVAEWAAHVTRKFILTPALPLPIRNRYATPATLGVDRIAGVCGALQLHPGAHCLVIDAGTCITYDFLDQDGVYHGGGISPGLRMRFQAVHTFTAKLPLIAPVDNPPLIGDSTETCIQSGVENGVVAELNGIIAQYREKFAGLRVILCGGDALFFENQLKGSIFAVPELVLSGLNSILIYNVSR